MLEIEEKIKPLVEVLNKIPYIRTFSSCEGHFTSRDERRHRAFVSFEISDGDEPKLEQLTKFILSKSIKYWTEAEVKIHKEWYAMPHPTEIRTLYQLVITPLECYETTATEKRQNTDNAIQRVVALVNS
jgi:hypothetical protein